jgi:hypothetical protein
MEAALFVAIFAAIFVAIFIALFFPLLSRSVSFPNSIEWVRKSTFQNKFDPQSVEVK